MGYGSASKRMGVLASATKGVNPEDTALTERSQASPQRTNHGECTHLRSLQSTHSQLESRKMGSQDRGRNERSFLMGTKFCLGRWEEYCSLVVNTVMYLALLNWALKNG